MLVLNPAEVRDARITIHAVTMGGAAYARVMEGDLATQQVFIPQGVVSKFRMRPGDGFECRIAPNNHERRDMVPWRVIYVVPKEEPTASLPEPVPMPAPAPVKRTWDMLTDEEIKTRIEQELVDGRVWTTREAFNELAGRDVIYANPDDKHKASVIGNHLRSLCRQGKMYRLELYTRTDTAYAVYFCSDIEELKPTGY